MAAESLLHKEKHNFGCKYHLMSYQLLVIGLLKINVSEDGCNNGQYKQMAEVWTSPQTLAACEYASRPAMEGVMWQKSKNLAMQAIWHGATLFYTNKASTHGILDDVHAWQPETKGFFSVLGVGGWVGVIKVNNDYNINTESLWRGTKHVCYAL